MPYYRGDSLDAFVRNGGTFSLEDLKSAIIPSLLESLKSIHEIGIIHKDLKPANIIVNEEDQNLVLIDFGISTETDGRTIVVTQTGKTPFYAAPETVSGAFSIYSDYYSLGICIYELYTGYTPFQNSLTDLPTRICLTGVILIIQTGAGVTGRFRSGFGEKNSRYPVEGLSLFQPLRAETLKYRILLTEKKFIPTENLLNIF